MSVRLRCRPLGVFPPEFSRTRQADQFSAPWSDTLDLLDRELAKLGARNGIIELAVMEGELRLDGFPYADARPTHPGVIVSFDSRHGPLRYGTDAFPRWQSNVRAIALGLEALRKVERYGIGRDGQQYVGWRGLPSGSKSKSKVERGRELIAEHGGSIAAIKATHPDTGGNPDDFIAVQEAIKA